MRTWNRVRSYPFKRKKPHTLYLAALGLAHRLVLALGHAVAEEHNELRQTLVLAEKVGESALHHALEVFNDLQSRALHPHEGRVLAHVHVVRRDEAGDRRLLVHARARMPDVCA